MKQTVFTGAGVAIVTPFTSDNKINYDKLAELIEFQIANKTDAIVICGTTGEGSTLDHEEHSEAIRFAVEVTNKRIPVIAGTGSNDTAYAVKLSNEAEKAGVVAVREMMMGHTGAMIRIRRISDSPYRIAMEAIDASKVANKDKPFPQMWINDEGNNVLDEAIPYFLPLIQGEVPIKYENGIPVHFKL